MTLSSNAIRPEAVLLALALSLASCGGEPASPSGPGGPTGPVAVNVPAKGTGATFDAATWNLEWLGDTGNGPADESLQLQRVGEVIRGARLDLWGLQEVVDEGSFTQLLAALPGYGGLLANASSVESGPAHYSDFGNREQKVALVFDTAAVQVLGARVILTDKNNAFAGRPPLEVRVRIKGGTAPLEAVVLVLHAKAGADEESWARREEAARALQAYLDATWPAALVWVLGDFNDDVDTSITTGRATPYAGFLSAGSGWFFPSAALSAAGSSSTVGYLDTIDHHLVSDEVAATYQVGSAEAWRLDQVVPDYGRTTSDHFPVLARYTLR